MTTTKGQRLKEQRLKDRPTWTMLNQERLRGERLKESLAAYKSDWQIAQEYGLKLREVLRDGADFATDTDDPVLHAWAKRARAVLRSEED